MVVDDARSASGASEEDEPEEDILPAVVDSMAVGSMVAGVLSDEDAFAYAFDVVQTTSGFDELDG